jgi:2-beta-glucuronyltransferase
MQRAVLITSHFWNSKRKAGFHHIADSLLKKDYEVLFLTGDVSYLRFIRKDYKNSLMEKSKYNTLLKESKNFSQFIKFTYLHPVNYKNELLNKLALPVIKNYSDKLKGENEINDFIKEADVIIFESFNGLFWFEHFKELNSKAKYIYRVSDDIRQLKKHFHLIAHEENISSKFDLVSVPSEYIYKLFKNNNVKLHHHGIRKDLFDKDYSSPYSGEDEFNYVFTGNAYLDEDFLKLASNNFPEDRFHIIGPFKKKSSDKIKYYGEIEFENTIPFIKYANAGLHTLEHDERAAAFTDSLKVIQYTYCRLPVIVPDFIKSKRENFIYYEPGNKSKIKEALEKAKRFDRSSIDVSEIDSWDEVTDKLLKT